MNLDKVATKFVFKLSKRLGVAIHPQVEMQLIGEIVSMMKSAQQSVEPTAPRIKAGDDFSFMLSQQIKKD